MTDPGPRLIAAQADAAQKRAQLAESVGQLKAKVNPRRIARQAVADATSAGETAAIVGVETARRYPGTLAGLVAAAGLFLARHRIAHLFRRARGRTTDKETGRDDRR